MILQGVIVFVNAMCVSSSFDGYSSQDMCCLQLKSLICSDVRNWTCSCQASRKQDNQLHGTIPLVSGTDFVYKGFKRKLTWQRAKEACTTKGGWLVMPMTPKEKKKLKRVKLPVKAAFLGLTVRDFWIGLHDVYGNDTFYWLDGTALDDADWLKGEPNHANAYNQENCVSYHKSASLKGWNDRECDRPYMFVCQFLDGKSIIGK